MASLSQFKTTHYADICTMYMYMHLIGKAVDYGATCTCTCTVFARSPLRLHNDAGAQSPVHWLLLVLDIWKVVKPASQSMQAAWPRAG